MTLPPRPWHTAHLVVLDIEGSGAEERDRDQILEIAVVRLVDWRLLHRHLPELAIAGLINTHHLAKSLQPRRKARP